MTAAPLFSPSSPLTLCGRRILLADGDIAPGRLTLAEGRIVDTSRQIGGDAIDLGDLLVAPGLIDLHGDAFERQIMPRPGVHFPVDLGLVDTDRQMAALGITTAAHGITASWEPGLRSLDAAEALILAIHALKPRLMVDTRVHLRHEVANAAGAARVEAWLAGRLIDLLALNDHLPDFIAMRARPQKLAVVAGRSGLSTDELLARIDALAADRTEQWAAARRLAALARDAGIPLLSHDDETPEARSAARALGARIAEFPVDMATARAAVSAGDEVMVGAPNLLRGTSHAGRLAARDAVAAGAATLVASDYSHAALLSAPFTTATTTGLGLARAWSLVSAGPARAAGLSDRGRLAQGLRADLVVIDDTDPLVPRVALTMAGGRLVHADATGIALLARRV
jgi:alpha-D-ribose 1-methylphosphonate 5-triphosphate diphosphatase